MPLRFRAALFNVTSKFPSGTLKGTFAVNLPFRTLPLTRTSQGAAFVATLMLNSFPSSHRLCCTFLFQHETVPVPRPTRIHRETGNLFERFLPACSHAVLCIAILISIHLPSSCRSVFSCSSRNRLCRLTSSLNRPPNLKLGPLAYK